MLFSCLRTPFFCFRPSPGRPGTEEFVPGHLLLPLSRDKGTPGQENFFVPGQRDNGTSRPVETLVQIWFQPIVKLLKLQTGGKICMFPLSLSGNEQTRDTPWEDNVQRIDCLWKRGIQLVLGLCELYYCNFQKCYFDIVIIEILL